MKTEVVTVTTPLSDHLLRGSHAEVVTRKGAEYLACDHRDHVHPPTATIIPHIHVGELGKGGVGGQGGHAVLRIRRLIERGDLDQAADAARDLMPGADWHDARTLDALSRLCGIGAGEIALAVLDGHSKRVGWVL